MGVNFGGIEVGSETVTVVSSLHCAYHVRPYLELNKA